MQEPELRRSRLRPSTSSEHWALSWGGHMPVSVTTQGGVGRVHGVQGLKEAEKLRSCRVCACGHLCPPPHCAGLELGSEDAPA